MNDIISTLIIIFASIALICLIILEILIHRGKRLDKEIEQCEELARAIQRGVTHEELMKMPMPKKLRKKFERIIDKYEKEIDKWQ